MSWLLCLLFFLFCALRLWFSCNMFKSTVLMISTVVQKSSPSRSISRFCTNDIWINRMPIMFHSLFCSQKFCLSRQRPGRYRDGNIFFFPQKKIGFFWSSHEAGNKKNISKLSFSSKNNYHNFSDVFNTLWPGWPTVSNKDQVMNSWND